MSKKKKCKNTTSATSATATAPKKEKVPYKQKVKQSYNRGYQSGWNDAMSIASAPFCVTAALAGYNTAVGDRREKEKADAKVKKYAKKSAKYEAKRQKALAKS